MLDLIVISAAAIVTLLILNLRLPLQNVIGLVVTIAVFWWATLLIAKLSGILFAPPLFGFSHYSREQTWGLFWLTGLVNARGITKLSLCRWRKSGTYGFWLIGVSSLLVTLEDANAREQMTFFAKKFLFVTFALIAMTPWLIDKKRIEQKPDCQPLIITILLSLW